MRATMMRLKGYLGINNGLLRDEITIDFSKSMHKICLIKGDTGSGKTTILNAISPLPDDNTMLVPGEQAEKEISYDNSIRILIIHPITNKGERATTKAYIYENEINLNPNGNVTSYKDIVFSKLELDSNFETLSKLSTRDRGLADKTPAIRKKSVLSIIDNVEVFNNIYKTLNKHSSTLKSMLQSIVAKMDSIGNEKSIDDNIKALESLVKQYEKQKEDVAFNNASALAIVSTLDPDGSIMKTYTDLTNKLNTDINQVNSQKVIIENACMRLSLGDANIDDIRTIIDKASRSLTELEISIRSSEESLNSLFNRNDIENQNLTEKLNKLKTLTDDNNYDILCNNIVSVEKELSEIRAFFDSIHVVSEISSHEYEVGLSIIDQISDATRYLYDRYTADVIHDSLSQQIDFTKLMSDTEADINSLSIQKQNIENQISICKGQVGVYKSLSNRPKGCTIDSCAFISAALAIGYNPEERIAELSRELENIENCLSKKKASYEYFKQLDDCYKDISRIVSRISDNKHILEKLPNMASICDIGEFKKRLSFKSSWTGILPDKSYIIDALNKSYMFDAYIRLKEQHDKLCVQKQIFESKHDVIDEINSDINKIKINLTNISDVISSKQEQIRNNKTKQLELEERLKDLNNLLKIMELRTSLVSEINDIQNQLQNISSNINKIREANATISATKETLDEINNSLKPTQEDLNRYRFNKQRLQEYREELAVYKERYEKTETVKQYTSPTKEGIQLLFMEMYMNNILSTANKLLSKIFNGQFMLQPFIINGDEFRIPCVGNKLMNDDISSMSTGQICMISMVLSFSILYNSSSKYNIIKLDEIDGGLDSENRSNFITVLNEIMQILGCEQCFLISHNEEIQYASTDVILLRSSTNSNYGDANIIFDARM